jgi:hypothetical protein
MTLGAYTQGGYTILSEDYHMTVTPQVLIGWDHDGLNLDGFKVYVNGGTEPVVTLDSAARTVSGPDLGLISGEYTITVSAFNAAAESVAAELTINVVTEAPAAPDNFRVISV